MSSTLKIFASELSVVIKKASVEDDVYSAGIERERAPHLLVKYSFNLHVVLCEVAATDCQSCVTR